MGEPSSLIKHEPPVEFVLILPRPTGGWLRIKQEDVKAKWWVKSVKLTKFDDKWLSKSKLAETYFTCPYCQHVAKHLGNLARHLRACGKIEPAGGFECDFCGKRFHIKHRMSRHMLTHSSDKKFCCINCGHRFPLKESLLKHSRPKTIKKCTPCDVGFSCKLLLYRHRREFHDNVFKCDKCPYKTKVQHNLMTHKGSHNKSFACATCQKKFSTKYGLSDHQTQHRHGIHASNPEETFDCRECDKTFVTAKTLLLHKKCVHDTKQVKCKVCDKIYKNRVMLHLHHRIHIKVECSICHDKMSKFVLAAHLRTHSAAHHFECDLCDFSTKIKRNIKSHIDRMHLLRRLLNDSECRDDFCDLELLEKLQLRYGSLATIREKKFNCDKCNKFFITPSIMKDHQRLDHSEKKFHCDICKKTLKSKDHLNRHNGHVHVTVSCSICHKKVGKRRMKMHMKVHQDKHFECDLCSYATQFKPNLEHHITRRHRKGALACNFGCHKKFSNFHQIFDHQKIHIGWKQWKCTKCDYKTHKKQDLFRHMAAKKH